MSKLNTQDAPDLTPEGKKLVETAKALLKTPMSDTEAREEKLNKLRTAVAQATPSRAINGDGG